MTMTLIVLTIAGLLGFIIAFDDLKALFKPAP